VRDEFSVEAADILHVGDSWECDVEGALAAGCRALWIDRSSTTTALGVPQAQDIGSAARWLVSNGCLTCLQSWSVVEQMFRPQVVRRRG
jgi:FMN phosphatase YigB (HAD superfamily)